MLDSDRSYNPQKFPLRKLKLFVTAADGARQSIPALDAHWLKRRKPFHSYVCMLSSHSRLKSGVELEEWEYIAKRCKEDWSFLLGLKHHEFWSYIVYHESAVNSIVTFLQRANPFYRNSLLFRDPVVAEAKTLYFYLLNLTVRIIMRLLTSEESSMEWNDKQHHRSLLYSNYLLSVPLLIDLVIAIGDSDKENTSILEQIFMSVLSIEPNYIADMREALAFYPKAFLSMKTQVENGGCEGAGGGVPLDNDNETVYDDVALFALDCGYTLRLFLKLCPKLLPICEEIKLMQCVASFYDTTVPMLYGNICMLNEQAIALSWLNDARLQFLIATRCLANFHLVRAQSNPKSDGVEKFLELLQDCLSAQTFAVDYQRQYPVEEDVNMLLEIGTDIGTQKVEFIVDGYQKALHSCNLRILADEISRSGSCVASSLESLEDIQDSPIENSVARDFDLEVTAVLDVLPDLGMGFIQRILRRYDNYEQAISAILDDNLPPDLAQIDRNEIYIPPDPQEKFQQESGINHFNIHDGDQYDVLTHDQPHCIIKQGKGLPNMARNAEELLDDKQHVKALKEYYKKFDLVEENSDEDPEYNDEYDDSYEALFDGSAAHEEQKNQPTGDTPNGVIEHEDTDNDDNSSKASYSNDFKHKKLTTDFCENPEVTRERYEARQQAKWSKRNPNGHETRRNVVGGPKGSGQTHDTQRNRSQKEAHKSSRANHNRKMGAAFKRSKGMVP